MKLTKTEIYLIIASLVCLQGFQAWNGAQGLIMMGYDIYASWGVCIGVELGIISLIRSTQNKIPYLALAIILLSYGLPIFYKIINTEGFKRDSKTDKFLSLFEDENINNECDTVAVRRYYVSLMNKELRVIESNYDNEKKRIKRVGEHEKLPELKTDYFNTVRFINRRYSDSIAKGIFDYLRQKSVAENARISTIEGKQIMATNLISDTKSDFKLRVIVNTFWQCCIFFLIIFINIILKNKDKVIEVKEEKPIIEAVTEKVRKKKDKIFVANSVSVTQEEKINKLCELYGVASFGKLANKIKNGLYKSENFEKEFLSNLKKCDLDTSVFERCNFVGGVLSPVYLKLV